MVDEAFALSPISARAVQPSEEDYDAISQAFMETSRGRWFLGEYAKRNRNADTRMVLDAVARIEETLAAQNLLAQNLAAQSLAAQNLAAETLAAQNLAEQQQSLPNTELADALAALRGTLDDARAVAESAMEGLAVDPHLAPIRKGIRVIREISWRWREIGADARICDLIDSQLLAIEGGCESIAACDPKAAVSPAFDLILQRIAALDEGVGVGVAASDPTAAVADCVDDGPASTAAAVSEASHANAMAASLSAAAAPEPVVAAEPDLSSERALAPDGTGAAELAAEPGLPPEAEVAPELELAAEPEPLAPEAEPVAPKPALALEPELAIEPEQPAAPISVVTTEVEIALQDSNDTLVDVRSEAKDIMAEIAEMTADTSDANAAAEAALDEAVLRRVAHEMAAPDEAGDEALFAIDDDDTPRHAAPTASQPIMMAPEPEPAPAKVLPQVSVAALPPETSPQWQPAAPPSPQSAAPTSLGSSLIANGIIRRPMSEADPLAPIRRMSQAEKIAFFS